MENIMAFCYPEPQLAAVRCKHISLILKQGDGRHFSLGRRAQIIRRYAVRHNYELACLFSPLWYRKRYVFPVFQRWH